MGIDAHLARQLVGERDGPRNDRAGERDGPYARIGEHEQVEAEAQKDDARAKELVGDKGDATATESHRPPQSLRQHAQQERYHHSAHHLQVGQLGEQTARKRAGEGERKRHEKAFGEDDFFHVRSFRLNADQV